MGATNFTTYYNLSQFIGTDKPAWLQDYNGDMLKIDTGINGAKTAADAAALAASTAQGTADANTGSISTLNTTVATHTNQITTLSGSVNTINSLIGNGTPTTTDQTIIGAINELNDREIVLYPGASNATVDTQLAAIESIFDGLSLKQKLHSVILIGDTTILHCNNINNKTFGWANATPTRGQVQCADLANHKAIFVNIDNGSITVSDYSSSESVVKLVLV